MICVVLGNSALAVVVIVSSILMITYVVVVGSAAARLILATRAMGSTAITTGEVTAELTPSELTTFLLTRADAQRSEALAKQMMFASDDVAP